jgi:hypothetical protein
MLHDIPGGSRSDPRLAPEASAALEDIYRRADAEIAATGALCWLRGECCDFTRSDHVLFATSVEIAYAREVLRSPFPPASVLCPFWKSGLCTERARRPLGCRTYFCDPSRRAAVERIYEKYHREIGTLAARFGIPYRYEPFVAALRTRDNGDAG